MIKEDFSGVKALVMGLGLNGGGLYAASFLAERGAELTVTDMRGAEILEPSIAALDEKVRRCRASPVRYVLGKHEAEDFRAADLVIKNPGVRPDSPFLAEVKRIETDISLFLRENPARLFAITGSKGKSFTASALHFGLSAPRSDEKQGAAYLGGNIALSPLSFLDKLTPADDVVLELSSWQLGDLPDGLLKPRAALMTALMSDHLDRYGSMERYLDDKKRIYQNQDASCATIIHRNPWSASFIRETRGRTALYGLDDSFEGPGGWFDPESGCCFARGALGSLAASEQACLVDTRALTPAAHQKINLLGAGLALLEAGMESSAILERLAQFPGIEHRLEPFFRKDGITFYNDSAATIPEAAAQAVLSLKQPILITGGTDKVLDFSPLAAVASRTRKTILLAGTASEKIAALLKEAHIAFEGPFDNLESCLDCALAIARSGDAIVLSPGCTSFGMFLNEFDRGRKWKALVRAHYGQTDLNPQY